ncbi:hypothetical protein ACFXJ8_05060 [Nonomuraea sp. NPDC059194]|uniref:hypothetical protein n=1 Tax=Nonomuraea sp. NPDC059194 TaxID=3346764 RepID=UPI0036C9524B
MIKPIDQGVAVQEKHAKRVLAGVLVALFTGLLAYKVLRAGHLEQTAVFYVGVPAVIAITVVLAARPRSATGMIMAVLTVALALAGPLLGEGIVCLVFAAPLFYLVGALIGLFVDHVGRRAKGLNALAVPLLLLVAVEGAGEATSLPRLERVSATRAFAGDIERSLASTLPAFRPYESALLRLGFPTPLLATGEGLEPGATREITFSPRRSLGLGAQAEPRAMTLRVKQRAPGRVVFTVVRDTTLARWLELREAEFAWSAGRLTVSLSYRRTFDPSWYFGPLQRYALTQAADYLAITFATPATPPAAPSASSLAAAFATPAAPSATANAVGPHAGGGS